MNFLETNQSWSSGSSTPPPPPKTNWKLMFGGGIAFILILSGGMVYSQPDLRASLLHTAKKKAEVVKVAVKENSEKVTAKIKEDYEKAGTVPMEEGGGSAIADFITPKFSKLPEDFPQDVAIFQPSSINLVSSKEVSPGRKSYTVIMTAGGVDPSVVEKFYKEKLAEDNWQLDEAYGLSGRVAVVGKKSDSIVNIAILDTSGSSQVTINYTPRFVVQ